MKGCSWPREHRHIICTCVPQVTRRSGPRVGPPWAQVRASHVWESIACTWAASEDGVPEAPSSVGKFSSS